MQDLYARALQNTVTSQERLHANKHLGTCAADDSVFYVSKKLRANLSDGVLQVRWLCMMHLSCGS